MYFKERDRHKGTLMHFFPRLRRLSLRKCLWLVEPRTPVCLNKQDGWGYKCLSFLVCIKKVFYRDSVCGGKTLLSLKIRRHTCSEHLSVLSMWSLTAGQSWNAHCFCHPHWLPKSLPSFFREFLPSFLRLY